MTKLLLLLLSCLLFRVAYGQATDTPTAYLSKIQRIVAAENTGNRLVQRLDSLRAKHIPSRSYVTDYFDRAIDLNFRQRRLLVSLNFYRFQVNLLCRHDTIFLCTITAEENARGDYYQYNQAVIAPFLAKRSQLYGMPKTAQQLLVDMALPEQYAFACGDGDPPTARGLTIERLVAKRSAVALLALLGSFNCETQAYGVAGLEMLQKRGYRLPAATQQLIERIKIRDSELVTCTGCLSGLVRKIYSSE